jgi:hypothetical protein
LIRISRAAAGLLLTVWIAAGLSPARAQENRTLVFFEPVYGAINDTTVAEDWTFAGRANQVISVLAVPISGDLDPVLQVTGPDGAIVGENDDRDSLVQDAGLEALILPADGTYTVRVTRYEGASGTTVGEYRLTLTPGFAQLVRQDTFEQGAVSWVTPTGELIALSQGKLQMRINTPGQALIAFPPDAKPLLNSYIQASARLFGPPTYAEFGLVFRAQVEPGRLRFYQFKVNTEGRWTVLLQDESSVYVLRTWQSDPALTGTEWTLAVLERDENLAFYANGVQLGTLSDTRLMAAGAAGVMVMNHPEETEPTTILVDDVLITTRLGSTFRGLPLALTAWDNPDPGVVVGELANTGKVSPAAARDLFIPDATLAATDQNARFELLGSDLTVYENFVLSAWFRITTNGGSAGCGVVYRWQDERNLDLAYVDMLGGFGVVQARDGQLTTNAYDLSPMVMADNANQLLVIAQGERVTLYINGALVTQEPVLPGSGRVGIALLNYEDVRTDCFWSNIWVWPLEE